MNAETQEAINDFLFEHFSKNCYISGYSGLVFVGYGDDEIYPHLIPLHINSVYDNRLRYHVEEDEIAHISDRDHKEYRSIAIRSFAQKDVINTILYGIDPEFQLFQEQNFKKFVLKYQNHIKEITKDASQSIKEEIESYDLDALISEMESSTLEIQLKKFVYPLFGALKGLSKEDLADMAESLIKLTYLKRRMMFHEESVSGPIDVAIITKGDGFIWQKRKHYFSKDLNPHFFQNYFKH